MTAIQYIKLICIKSVIETAGIKKSTIYKKIKNGSFPAPIKIGKRSSRWVEHEIQEWIVEQITSNKGDS
jgi:prophage regulatory protein